MTAPIITASLSQNNMDVTIPVNVTNAVPAPILPTFNTQGSTSGSGTTSYTLTLNGPTQSGDTVVVFAWTDASTGSSVTFSGLGATWRTDANGAFVRGVATDCTAGLTTITITYLFTFSVTALAGAWTNAGVAPGGAGVGRQEHAVGPTIIDAVAGSTISPVSGQLAIVGWELDPTTTGVTSSFSDTNGTYNQLTSVSGNGAVVEMGWAIVPANGTTNHVGTRADSATGSGGIYVFGPNVSSGPGAVAPFTYTIDYDDGVTDSFTTSSTTHTFAHTYLDTTPKIIKVQAYTTSSGIGMLAGITPKTSESSEPSYGADDLKWFFYNTSTITISEIHQYWRGSSTGGRIGICSDTHSDPLNSITWLGYEDFVSGDITSSTYNTFVLNVPVTLMAGTQYSFVVANGAVNIGYASSYNEVGLTRFDGNDYFGSGGSDFSAGNTAGSSYFQLRGAFNTILYSNIVLLYPTWVTGSAVNNSTRTAFI